MTYKSMTLDVISADAPSMCMTYKSMTLDVISADAPSMCMTYRNLMSTAGKCPQLAALSNFFLVLSYVLLKYAVPKLSHEKLKA
jgi:hypothetical protein